MPDPLQDSTSARLPSSPRTPMAATSVARTNSQGTPVPSATPTQGARMSVDAIVAQPAPQYPVYRPRSGSVRPPRPTRSVPPVPDQIDTTRGLPSTSRPALNTAPLSRSQSLLDSPAQEIRTQTPEREVEVKGEQKAVSETNDALPHVKSVAANPIEALNASNPNELTPLRAHYLKKSLIQMQFERELEAITTVNPHWPNVSTLSYLGQPFQPPPKDAPVLDMPFLRYFFRQFILTFPFMASAPKDFYSQKLQPFVTSMIARNLSASSVLDDDEAEGKGAQASGKKLLSKVEKNMSLFLGAATRLAEKEEVVRLTQVDLDRLESLTKKRQARMKKNRDWFEINIVCVRTVMDKGRVRSRAHDEFVIRTRRSRYEDVYVSRRYGDFRTLATELTKAHPEEYIKPPPQKDRTFMTVNSPTTPGPPRPSMSSDSVPYDPTAPEPTSRLAREKNRLTLRSYLHTLMASPTVLSSPVFRSFLLSGSITLTAEEREDVKRREEADRVREDGRKKFAKEIASRVDGLRDAVKSVKGDIMGKGGSLILTVYQESRNLTPNLAILHSDGLTHVFGTIKVTPNIRDLPPNYQAVTEWARISLASTVFQQFVASDNASETFAGLKRIHGLMPYFMLKAALKISNPIGMIRSVLDLFLAQPFGGRSLLQRMFTSSLTEEVKSLQEEIEAVKDKVDDPVMSEKIRQFVYAPREIQEMFKADAVAEKMNIFVVILRSGEHPALGRPQMHRLARAHRAHAVYMKHKETLEDSDDDDGPQDEDAWLLEDLKVLAYLYTRLRDREMLIELIFEGFTAELLKDIITIFYSPLAQVYRAASIADSLGDLQNFINDLIKTVEHVEEMIQDDPTHTVQAFIDLIQRHEQSFYYFVHKVHSKGEGLFNSLMQWIEMFLTVVREGLGDPLSLEFLLPHTGDDRTNILAEVDKVAMYHYKLKVVYEDKLRRRFGNAEGQRDADAEDEATRALVNGVLGDIDFGELAGDNTLEFEDGDIDSEDDYTSSDYETGEEDTDSETGSSESASSNTENSARSAPAPHTGPLPLRLAHNPKSASTATFPSNRASQTLSKNPAAAASSSSVASTPSGPTRKRSLSLRHMKSLTSLGSKKQSVEAVPPVPPIPRTPQTAVPIMSTPTPSSSSILSKSLPPLPPAQPARPSQSQAQQRQSPPLSNKVIEKKRKRKENLVQPPELVHIPQLLPVFVELMRPALQVRRINQK
ncbi:hypothetical protein NP233_g10967 [Leucocoprinus birnbaumii]|uniref:PX domain-containing protein n=1 Tax=Leucocoprinus birnbaumii TaxID=56174 RepID=A0AAD5VJS0_9AGAR|nr:hypothetical protein NP233_g10967 [Leucocoprinus birnbaumii]